MRCQHKAEGEHPAVERALQHLAGHASPIYHECALLGSDRTNRTGKGTGTAGNTRRGLSKHTILADIFETGCLFLSSGDDVGEGREVGNREYGYRYSTSAKYIVGFDR
jgi:hypothetical protein